MASLDIGTQKRRKTDDELLESFHDSFLSQNSSFVDAVYRFIDITTGLGAFTIGSCNAADPDNGCSFNKAVCTIKPTQRVFAFANFFVDAFRMLKNFVTKREIPSDSEMKMLLLCLIRFLVNTENQEGLSQVEDCTNDTELSVLLAFHLFTRLSASPRFIIDDQKLAQPKACPCRRRHGKVAYGDTSIGNPDVWHGCLDLIMEGSNVSVDTLDQDSEASSDRESGQIVTRRTVDMTDNSMGSGLVQLAAKTIVHSFYYRLVYPERENSLIPNVGVSSTGLIFYFYDSVHDVLLGSSRFPLAAFSPFEINFTTVIALWMVLNHKYLCNGLSSVDIQELPKSGFVTAAQNKLHIYRAELRQGGVNTRLFIANSLDPLSFVNSKFILSDVLKDV